MSLGKFDGMGKIYSAARPSYPNRLIDFIFSGYARDEILIADIGSGTGILTRLLLERGAVVYAVEPNADMKAVAEENLSGYNNFISINGTAEKTGLEDNFIDMITAAQAFHWFDLNEFKKECGRILKKDGNVFLIWNVRGENNDIFISYNAAMKKYCPGYSGQAGGMEFNEINKFEIFFGGAYEETIYENDLTYDRDGFIRRALSTSYALKKNDPGYPAFTGELGDIFDRFNENGIIKIPNQTQCYSGRLK